MSEAERGSGRYVYCITKSLGEKKSFGSIGFEGNEVYTLDYRDFALVISNSVVKKYEIIEEDVEIYKQVVERVMKEYSVLPVAYGMVFKNKKLLQTAINVGYRAMKKAMKEVDNRVELGIKVFLPNDTLKWDRKEKHECRSGFLEALKKKAVQSKELKLFSDRLILNASFLVDRDKISDFSGGVEQLRNKYTSTSIKTQYSGPWPPYNFVDIHILSRQRGGFR